MWGMGGGRQGGPEMLDSANARGLQTYEEDKAASFTSGTFPLGLYSAAFITHSLWNWETQTSCIFLILEQRNGEQGVVCRAEEYVSLRVIWLTILLGGDANGPVKQP